jgi:hypothetical protein
MRVLLILLVASGAWAQWGSTRASEPEPAADAQAPDPAQVEVDRLAQAVAEDKRALKDFSAQYKKAPRGSRLRASLSDAVREVKRKLKEDSKALKAAQKKVPKKPSPAKKARVRRHPISGS